MSIKSIFTNIFGNSQKKINKLLSENEDKQKEIEELKQKISQLNSNLKQFEIVKGENFRLKQEIASQTSNNDNVEVLKNEILRLKQEISSQTSNNDNVEVLKNEILRLKQEISSQTSNNDNVEALKNEILRLKQEIASQTSNNDNVEALKNEILRLKQEIASQTSNNDNVEALKNEILRLKQEIASQTSNNDNVEVLKNEILRLKQENFNLNQIISNNKGLTDVLSQENTTLKNENLNLKQIIQTNQSKQVIEKKEEVVATPKAGKVDENPIERYRISKSDFFVDENNIEKFCEKIIDFSLIDRFFDENPNDLFSNAFEKYKKNIIKTINKIDTDDEIEDNLYEIAGTINKSLLSKLMISSYRGKDEFDIKFSKVLVEYIKNLGFYSRNNIQEKVEICDSDYDDMEIVIIDTNKVKNKEIINIELLPYYLNFIDEAGKKGTININGKMYVAKNI